MKKALLKIIALGLFAMAIVAAPLAAHAQTSTNGVAKKTKKNAAIAFTGKVSAVDTNAMTLTVGKHVFDITADTKITKDGQPATLADVVVGEKVMGSYKTGTDGKLTATTVDYSTKVTTAKKKKKTTATADTTDSAAK